MYLKRLEIYGFKSFAHRSVLDFEFDENGGNITAVVGPNGSGKSNIADAIRWVLGEQSNKLLRGKKSEDVLFLGSQTKSRGSFSEVILFLESQKPAKAEINGKSYEFNQIEISRKLYRSGDSEYLINRKKVRLVDVQQLLATLGFGQSTYTVIGQGMVDRLLFFSASERKTLFDEAAGVKQYELKRDQVVRRLTETSNNLIRLKDILSELEPRVDNLRKLVKRAEGRKEIELELNTLQDRYYGNLIFEYRKNIEDIEGKKKFLNKKVIQLDEEVQELEEKVNENSESTKIIQERLKIESNINKATVSRDLLMQKVAFIEGQINQQGSKLLFLNKQKDELEIELKQNEEKIKFLDERIKVQCNSMKDFEAEQKNFNIQIEKLENDLSAIDRRLENPKESADAALASQIQDKIDLAEKNKHDLSLKIYSIKQNENINKDKAKQLEKRLEIENSKLEDLREVLELLIRDCAELEKENVRLGKELDIENDELNKILGELKKIENGLREFNTGDESDELKKFEEDLEVIIKDRDSLFGRIQVCSSVKDLSVVKGEMISFSKNLNQLFNKIKRFVKGKSASERKALELQLTNTRELQNSSNSRLNDLKIALAKLEVDLSSKKIKIGETQDKINIKEEEIRILSSQEIVNDVSNNLPVLEKDLENLNNELTTLNLEYKKYASSVNEYQNAILIEKSNLQEKLNKLRKEKYELEVRITRAGGVADNQRRELDSALTRSQELRKIVAELAGTKADKDESLIMELTEKKKELKGYELILSNLRSGLTEVISKQKENEQLRFESNRKIQGIIDEKTRISLEINSFDLDNAKNAAKLESVLEEVHVLGIVVASIKEGENEDLDQMTKDTLRAKIENLRRRLETIGGIDPETEKEFEELNEKNEEMKIQVEDLELAKENLEKVINELDGKIRSQFSYAFKSIEKEFAHYFNILFNGGKASLNLGTDEEGFFGVEITATPPGKRVQSLSALSGGERTLTSLALLFAILSVNPSPFCVLDEVDAALDDSNTLRYAKILHSLAQKTQFIVISHNQETMKSAKNLYGVTMNDEHVSKLISIRLAEALEAANK